MQKHIIINKQIFTFHNIIVKVYLFKIIYMIKNQIISDKIEQVRQNAENICRNSELQWYIETQLNKVLKKLNGYWKDCRKQTGKSQFSASGSLTSSILWISRKSNNTQPRRPENLENDERSTVSYWNSLHCF